MRTIKTMPTPESEDPHGGVAQWFVEDPGSHPLWFEYIVILMHLRPVEGLPSPVMYGDYGYEWQMYAIDPEHRLPDDFDGFNHDAGIHWLEPANHIYQFNAENDAAAMERIELLLNQAPSLDTDFTSWFDLMFEDGVSLKR